VLQHAPVSAQASVIAPFLDPGGNPLAVGYTVEGLQVVFHLRDKRIAAPDEGVVGLILAAAGGLHRSALTMRRTATGQMITATDIASASIASEGEMPCRLMNGAIIVL